MNELTDLIDRLPTPQIPDSYSEIDRHLIKLLLASARQQIRPYDGNFAAPWLLVPFENDIWETTNRGREELIDGEWKNTVRINWRVRLPNGNLLTDARYKKLLAAGKKVAFLMRSDLICGASAPRSWSRATSHLVSILRWVVLYEERFQPEFFALSLIDQASLDWLLNEFARGGSTEFMKIPQRLLAAMYLGAHGTGCPSSLLNDPCKLPASEISPIIRWAESLGKYKNTSKGQYVRKQLLSRVWLSTLINESVTSLRTNRVIQFIRQFEPDFGDAPLLVSLQQKTEFPSQRIDSLEVGFDNVSESSIYGLGYVLRSIFDAHRHLPDLLPDPARVSLRRAGLLANRIVRPTGHTPLMPLNTGLSILNVAMRFVQLYGDSIIGLFLAALPAYRMSKTDGVKHLGIALKEHANDWRIASGEQITDVLNIIAFRSRENPCNFSRFRSNPTLDEALRVLIGSCIVCMAILKPSREEELTHVKRNCLRHDESGYWFNFNLGKSNVKGIEAWRDADRPIPVVTAKAIQLLQRLGEGLSQLLGGNEKSSNNLFYLPKFEGLGALNASDSLLNEHLDIFCDFVALSPDDEGRRWYVRIHEMRKWFLLLLFWSGRFDVLDAARWIAGHTNAEHIYAYIEKEFPGEELPEIEAQYSEERLRRLKLGDAGNEDGANNLYEHILQHFNVESLQLVPDSEWTTYVRNLRLANKFHLEPHSIKSEDGSIVGINVSFVMREIL